VTDDDAGSAPCEFTVVIPARNEERTLPAQLEALLAQEWSGTWEVVVADNGSTDRTAEVVRRFGAIDSRVRLVDAGARPGLSACRNAGTAAGRGRSFALCDADDLVGDGWLAAMGEALRDHEFVTGPLELDRLNPGWLAATRGRGDERGVPMFYGVFPFAHGNNLGMQRAVWERLGRFDEGFPNGAEDIEFGLRAWRAGVAVHFVDGAVVHYRYRGRPRELWRQGTTYGRSRPLVRRRLKELGARAPSPVAGWRSWLWLVRHLPGLRSPEGRAAWVWVAANRVGHVQGSLRHRCLLV
jgi:glycosyltransferase involved in cell wall biosynthesis